MNLKDNINSKLSLILGITFAVFIDLILSRLMFSCDVKLINVQLINVKLP